MRNKIVLVPFPFDDLSGTKARPALCLTDAIKPYNHVVVAFITSKVPANPAESDIILRGTDTGFPATGLKVDSAIRLHRLITLSKTIFNRQLGAIDDKTAAAVRARIKKLFSIE